MPQKVTDITAKVEKPQETVNHPEIIEKPAGIEVAPEVQKEKVPEAPSAPVTEQAPISAAPQPAVSPVAPPQAAKSPTLEKIENILEEDLEQFYFQLPADKQAELRASGEITATRIEKMLTGVKVNIKKILTLIVNWLKIIPGINKFFLEQEAKIKTDELLKLGVDQKQQRPSDQNRII